MTKDNNVIHFGKNDSVQVPLSYHFDLKRLLAGNITLDYEGQHFQLVTCAIDRDKYGVEKICLNLRPKPSY